MKKLIFIILLSSTLVISTGAQVNSPCLIDTNPAPLFAPDRSVALPPGWSPPMVIDPARVPAWEPRVAFIEPAVKLNSGAVYFWPFFMPAAGRCVGAFDSYYDRTDGDELLRAAIGAYTGLPMPKPKGDVEVMILTAAEFREFKNYRSHATRYSSGKTTGGSFYVDLSPGHYVLLVTNRHDSLAPKVASVVFGGKMPTP